MKKLFALILIIVVLALMAGVVGIVLESTIRRPPEQNPRAGIEPVSPDTHP